MLLARALLAVAASLLVVVPGAAAAPVGEPTTIASGLQVPWEVVPLPDGRILFTERDARTVRVIEPDGTLRAAPAFTFAEPNARKVLGLEPHPEYATNRLLYAYVTRTDTGSKVLRLRDDGTNLVLDREIFTRPIGTDGNHDGGRIKFGPDGKLYVTTGDIHNPDLPQDRQSLNGKILRLNDDGTAPDDNPFVAEGGDARFVWSYGHRHPQGIAWDATGRMWETEHGPSGETYGDRYPGGNGRCCRDEVNLVVRGGNYGWPLISGAESRDGLRAPVVTSGDTTVWAPGGLAFSPVDGRLYATLLAGQHLRQFLPAGDGLVDEGRHFAGTRLRAATVSGSSLLFTTDKRSGPVDEIRRVALAAPAPPVPAATPAQRLADRAAARLRRGGLRRFARSGGVRVRATGFEPGVLRLRVQRRPRGGRARTVAVGRAPTRAGAAVTVRARLGRRARRTLRRVPVTRMVVRATFVPRAGERSSAAVSLVVRR